MAKAGSAVEEDRSCSGTARCSRHGGAMAMRVGGRAGRCSEDEEWQAKEVCVMVEWQW